MSEHAPFSLHGVFLEVFGKGVLLTGAAGIGKSTCALRLLERDHRFIADDAPFFYVKDQQLMGCCPPPLQYFLAVRQVGLLDVKALFGEQAMLTEKRLDLIIECFLQAAGKPTIYPPTSRILSGVHITQLTLCFTSCHDMAILVESAVGLQFASASSKNVYSCD